MKAAIIQFPGSNRDHDMAVALEKITGRRPFMVWHAETALPAGLDLIVLPGGFSYGDYLRTGAIAAHAPVMRAVADRAAAGAAIMGVCNGFQILCEAGLLPGVLMRNADLRFACHDVHLRIETSNSVFTGRYNAGDVVRCPIAHGEGNYFADDETLKRLTGEDRIAFRYVDAGGAAVPEANPNGSRDAIAGILSERRNILGLMPHPENMIEPLHGSSDCRRLFEGLSELIAA